MRELFCFAIIPFVVGVVYAVLISLLIMRDKNLVKKKNEKEGSKTAKHKIFSSVGVDRKRNIKEKEKREMYHS